MGRNKDTNIRKLTKVGKCSYCIALPMDVVKKFKWRERQKLQLKVDNTSKTVTIKDWVEN